MSAEGKFVVGFSVYLMVAVALFGWIAHTDCEPPPHMAHAEQGMRITCGLGLSLIWPAYLPLRASYKAWQP